MKKLLTWFFILGLLGLGAADLKIFCTTYPVWLLTRELTDGVKGVRTELMIPAGTGCPHEYVLTPADLRKLGTPNLLVVRNGLGLDDFMLKPLRKVNPEAGVITACEGLDVLRGECHHDHHGEHEHTANPHLFASPDTAAGMIANIGAGLRKYDPAHADAYRRNEEIFLKKLKQLTTEMTQLKKVCAGKTVAVQHGIFDYLMRGLGLHTAAEISPEGTMPSAAGMKEMVRKFRKEKVSLILTEPQYPSRLAETLAKECCIPVCCLDPLAGGPERPGKDYYIRVMSGNLEKLRKALSK